MGDQPYLFDDVFPRGLFGQQVEPFRPEPYVPVDNSGPEDLMVGQGRLDFSGRPEEIFCDDRGQMYFPSIVGLRQNGDGRAYRSA